MQILEEKLSQSPQTYLSLPPVVQNNKTHGVRWARLAIEHAGDNEALVRQIYDGMPLAMRNSPVERTQQGVAYLAVKKIPALYAKIPLAIRTDSWALLDACIDVLIKNPFDENDEVYTPRCQHAVPPVMWRAFLHFWHNIPDWFYHETRLVYCCCEEARQFRAETLHAMTTGPSLTPILPMAQALAWLHNDAELGYAMLPNKLDYPELVLEILEKPHALRMVPPQLLEEQHLDRIRQLAGQKGAAFVSHLPPVFLEAHKHELGTLIGERLDPMLFTKQDMLLVPSQVWTVERAKRVLYNGSRREELYWLFPDAIVKQLPYKPRGTHTMYRLLYRDDEHYEFKKDKIRLAMAALRADRDQYQDLPASMTDIDMAPTPEARALVLELAQLVLTADHRTILTPNYFKFRNECWRNDEYRVANADTLHKGLWIVPGNTLKALFYHLYATQQHEFLRCLGVFKQTRDMLLRKQTWQRRTLVGGLGTFLAHKIVQPLVFSEIDDYKHWIEIEMRFLWTGVNHLLYETRYDKVNNYDHTFLNNMGKLFARNIRRFCMYPWTSIDDADETVRDYHANMRVINEIFDTGSLKRKKTTALFMDDKSSRVNYLQEIAADDLVAPDETGHTDEQKAITQSVHNRLRDILLLWLVAASDLWKEDEKDPDFWNVVTQHLRPSTSEPNLQMAQDAWNYANRGKVPFDRQVVLKLYPDLHIVPAIPMTTTTTTLTEEEEEGEDSGSDEEEDDSGSDDGSMTSSEDGSEIWNEELDSRPRQRERRKHRTFFFQAYPQWAPAHLYDTL
jgi:hypothetical protein